MQRLVWIVIGGLVLLVAVYFFFMRTDDAVYRTSSTQGVDVDATATDATPSTDEPDPIDTNATGGPHHHPSPGTTP